jgi:hypothetical protein
LLYWQLFYGTSAAFESSSFFIQSENPKRTVGRGREKIHHKYQSDFFEPFTDL